MNLYPAGKLTTYWLVRLLFKMRYEGLEHVPKNQGFILASNHRSNFDPLFIAHKVPQQLRFMAKMELFRNRFLDWLMTSLGAFPIERGAGDKSTMEYATQIVQEGQILMIFPEGHRSKDGKPLRARSGIGMVASQTKADVLPCAVIFGEKLRFRCRVTVRYGSLIPYRELGLEGDSPSGIRGASKRVMADIVSLLEPQENGQAATPGQHQAEGD